MNSFGAGSDEELARHPTSKPVALVADAMRDCTSKGDLVLDPFLGAGTTLLAAEKVGRRCYGIEYEPTYVDCAVRRWQAYTGRDAILENDGRTFDEIAAERASALGQRSLDSSLAALEASQAACEDDAWVRLCGTDEGHSRTGGEA